MQKDILQPTNSKTIRCS